MCFLYAYHYARPHPSIYYSIFPIVHLLPSLHLFNPPPIHLLFGPLFVSRPSVSPSDRPHIRPFVLLSSAVRVPRPFLCPSFRPSIRRSERCYLVGTMSIIAAEKMPP